MLSISDMRGRLVSSPTLFYQITCSCGDRYIGETSRCLKIRYEEHCRTSGTGITEVGKHLIDNPTHTLEFSNVKILGFESNMRKRRVLESIFIQDSILKHTLLNDNLKSVPLYIFNLPRR